MPRSGEVGGCGDWITGAYKIICKVDGLIYVGGAYKDFDGRKNGHWNELRNGTHFNPYLQAAWDEHGEENFEFKIIERSLPDYESVRACEQKWLDRLRPWDPAIGYNRSPTAESTLGMKHSEESKERHRVAAKKRMENPETREKLAAANRGKKASPETRAKMSEKLKKRMSLESEKKRVSEQHKGKKVSRETVEKILASKAVNGTLKHTEETKRKLSEINTGKKLSEETRRKISEKNTGRVVSEETRAKLSVAHKGRPGNGGRRGKKYGPDRPEVREAKVKLLGEIRSRPEVKKAYSESAKKMLAIRRAAKKKRELEDLQRRVDQVRQEKERRGQLPDGKITLGVGQVRRIEV